jgi:cytoskeletal protein CcmA (bactofilin family)
VRPGEVESIASRLESAPKVGRGLWYEGALMPPSLPTTEITALLGRGTHFEGKLEFDGRVRIDGSFRGQIRTSGVLIVGDGAEVDAEIETAVLIVKGGTLQGSVQASESIELYVPARVSGTLRAPEIFMDKGVQFSGSCSIEPRTDTPANA